MKTFKLALAVLLLAGVSPLGFAAESGSPQSVKIKFYDLWVSPNTDCTGMTRVFVDANPSYQDVVAGPTFGQTTITNGTYQCIAFKMSDVIKLTPNFTSDSGHCVQGTEITRDLFRPGDVSLSPTGTTINGSGAVSSPIEDTMYVYLSLTGNDTTNSGNTPSSPGRLANAYVVGGETDATFVFDFTNGLVDQGGACSPEVVTFSFRY